MIAKQAQVLTVAFCRIMRKVREENLLFHHRREMFNPEYFRFVRVLCSANDPGQATTLSTVDAARQSLPDGT